MYFNSFSSVPSLFATTNFTSTIYLSCFSSILSLSLKFSTFLSLTFCNVLVSFPLSVIFYPIFIGVECFGFVSSLVGVSVVMMFCSGQISIKPYSSLLSFCSVKPLGNVLMNFPISSFSSTLPFSSNFPEGKQNYNSPSCLKGMEFLNC